jgi:hypothetical protein
MIPENYSPAEKRIVNQYLIIMETSPLAGSMLCRQIATSLFYKLDMNNSNSFVRRTVKKYQQELGQED